jgi:hypothetical protein
MKRASVLALILAMPAGFPAFAATPPASINYQGVLRDSNDKPLTGTYDMTFGFYDALTGGNQILLDVHAVPAGIVVSGGLFNAQLGTGTISDGSGPGIYTGLDQVFRDDAAVWMELIIGGQTLSPRVRVVGAPYALNAANLEGRNAASFIDTSPAGQTKAGMLNVNGGMNVTGTGFALTSNGSQAGGAFGAGSSFAYVADVGSLKSGIRAQGDDAGGWFVNNATGSRAYCAYGTEGIEAQGTVTGGHFSNSAGASASLADWTAYPFGSTGIRASGNDQGGFFTNTSGTGLANVAIGDYGIVAGGRAPNGAGGYFIDQGASGTAWLGSGNWGIQAWGRFCGVGCGGAGSFRDTTPGGAYAYLGYSNVGIEAHTPSGAAGSAGSFYVDSNGIGVAIGNSLWAIMSNGVKSFAQNHPEDPAAVVSYVALEGDEAGTYTRGTARLVDGEARIALGETFQWVTNPDVGLTAQLTPRGQWADLYVASETTKEIVVRSRDPHATDVAFDYLVLGLRVGFENMPVVHEKEQEMPIPADASGDPVYARRPEFERYSALSRFSRMRQESAGKIAPLDLRASETLKSKIHVFDPQRDSESRRAASPPDPGVPAAVGLRPAAPLAPAPDEMSIPKVPSVPTVPPAAPGDIASATEAASTVPNSSLAEVESAVEAGDVLANDATRPGLLKRADQQADAGVVGIVGGEAGAEWRVRAPLALAGTIVPCKVDASYGAIQPNDLLVASPTSGHAMRAGDSPQMGTVIGKALEPLAAGTGTIRVLTMSR